jgi:NAD(P)H-hydrate epimerase
MTKNDVIGDSLVYHDKCVGDDIPILYSTALPKILPKFDLMIDAILGIGFTGELKDELLLWTAWLNEDQITVSADIPTGVNANTGHVATGAVRAGQTITMGFEKLGMALEPGKSHSGSIHQEDIGFPNIIDDLEGRKWSVIQDDDIRSILHPLKKTTHKHVQGKVLVLAGSTGMTGAAYLTSIAALRSGAGLVITFAPESLHSVYERYDRALWG